MHVVADMVRTAVPHVFANLIVRGQQTDLFQLLTAIAAGGLIHIVHEHTGLDDGEHVVRRIEGTLIQHALLFRVFAVARPATGDIVALAVPLRANVIQDHIAVFGLSHVAVVMDAKVVFAGGNDGVERGLKYAGAGEGVVELGFILVLIHAGVRSAHHAQNALARNGHGTTHGVNLARSLQGTQAL